MPYLESVLPVYLDSVYSEKDLNLASLLLTVIGSVGLVLTCVLLFVIQLRTPRAMHRFKHYLLAYTVSNLYLELFILLDKPLLVPSFGLVLPYGLIRNQSPATAKLLLASVYCSVIAVLVYFLQMFVDRFLALSPAAGQARFYHKSGFYFVLSTVFLAVCVAVTYTVMLNTPLFMDEAETEAFIRQRLIDGEVLLRRHPSLIIPTRDFGLMAVCIAVLTLVGVLYATAMSTVYSLSLLRIRNSLKMFTKKSRANHLMLFRCLTFQLAALFVLVLLPLVVLLAGFLCNWSNGFVIYPLVVIYSFPVVDSLVTVVSIRPYREFFGSFLLLPAALKPAPSSRIHHDSFRLFVVSHPPPAPAETRARINSSSHLVVTDDGSRKKSQSQ